MSEPRIAAEDRGDDRVAERLRLQDRFLRALSGLRRAAGLTQRSLADRAGWHQPYVARLEDERSPLITSLGRLERYAESCGATALIVFVDKQTGAERRTLALGEAGDRLIERVRRENARFAHCELPDGQIDELQNLLNFETHRADSA